MSVLFIVVPLAFLLAGGFLVAFLWSVKRGQFDDLDSPAMRAVFDDEPATRRRTAPPDRE